MSLARPLACLLLPLLALPGAATAASAPMGELVDRSTLRVCADPNNLPFSNRQGEGFENAIAALIAQRLGVPVTYTWYPQSMGFVRSTLRAHLCDLVMGVASANELLQNTNPYYRSTYVLAYRDGDERFADLDGAAMREARIGVIAGTPPADLLVERGLLGQAQSYHLMVDTRYGDHPGKQMIDDLAAGRIDVALLWGPIAGYWIGKQGLPVNVVPLHSDRPGQRLDFRISMGIRPGEPGWKQDLNGLIRELQPEINAILASYGVPLLDNRGRLITPGPANSHGAAGTDP